VTAWPIITVAVDREVDVVAVRQRARTIATELGFDVQDQTRIATAVSEIARNALGYAGRGRAEFTVEPTPGPPRLVVVVSDAGPGIPDLEGVLAGTYRSATGHGLGIVGAHRLMDFVAIDTQPGEGTVVRLEKRLPKSQWTIAPPRLAEVARKLAGAPSDDALAEIRAQNQELMRSLNELKARQEETTRLNQELERTNQGVVALYAELDHKAVELQTLNATLEERVARAIGQQEEAEASLRQSQKMEAVGQLTGGVAHDFNNLLQIIIGNLDVLVRKLPEQPERMRQAARNAMEGAQRAAVLTQRLLAFSRRQPLDPKPVLVNALVEGMLDLLKRTLGETMTMETCFCDEIAMVEVDPNQLENALVNLAVNARDAMQGGGTLRIRTANVTVGSDSSETESGGAVRTSSRDLAPGRYVAIAVEDTGTGMSEDTLARVFEPFFTTKDVGKGTGLGLSMVYGFVKQSGGQTRIASREDRGTTVTLLFPAIEDRQLPDDAPGERVLPLGQREQRILVVEDDQDVRAYTCEALRELSYEVVEAHDGPSALQALAANRNIDLLFTDVVLPGGVSGRELAEQALARHPGLDVLYTTGYARDAIVHFGRLDPGVHMLPKPFSFDDLAERVSAILSRPKAS
jgi:signal transduction histidine kinase/ActR/RegA family two-component response regulator